MAICITTDVLYMPERSMISHSAQTNSLEDAHRVDRSGERLITVATTCFEKIRIDKRRWIDSQGLSALRLSSRLGLHSQQEEHRTLADY